MCPYFLQSHLCGLGDCSSLDVRPSAVKVSGGLDSNASLTCLASVKPVLCLWKTPYGHIYTLSEGVSAESGRLSHSASRSGRGCGLEIHGLEPQDAGNWECEIGAVVGENFQTESATIQLQVKSKQTAQHNHFFEDGQD